MTLNGLSDFVGMVLGMFVVALFIGTVIGGLGALLLGLLRAAAQSEREREREEHDLLRP